MTKAQNNAAAKAPTHKGPAAVEGKKVHTLSLDKNKRAEDGGIKERQADKMPEVAEKALASAAQALHDGQTKGASKPIPAENLSDIPRVVFRVDARNNGFCFMVDTMDAIKNTISMYDMAHGSDKEEVPVDFYRTLKPMEQKQRDKAIRTISEKLGVTRLVVRDRLLKSHMLERDTEGKIETRDLEAWKAKLIKAVTEAIMNA